MELELMSKCEHRIYKVEGPFLICMTCGIPFRRKGIDKMEKVKAIKPDKTQPEMFTYETLSSLQDLALLAGKLEHQRLKVEATLFELNRQCMELTYDNDMLVQTTLKHGQHKEDCSYYEEIDSGRITNSKSCSCGWNDLKAQLKLRIESDSSLAG